VCDADVSAVLLLLCGAGLVRRTAGDGAFRVVRRAVLIFIKEAREKMKKT